MGCNIGRTFCASGLLCKSRDLDSGEIVEQIMNVQKHLDEQGNEERGIHIVLMESGELFDNFNNLIDFLRVVNDDNGFCIGASITLSTSGLAYKIYKFVDTGLQVNLAFFTCAEQRIAASNRDD